MTLIAILAILTGYIGMMHSAATIVVLLCLTDRDVYIQSFLKGRILSDKS